jgi:hypothetical protein
VGGGLKNIGTEETIVTLWFVLFTESWWVVHRDGGADETRQTAWFVVVSEWWCVVS